MNVVGEVFFDIDSIGVDTVIWNNEGLVMASQARRFFQAYSPLVIEALAALHGLQLVQDLGFTHAVLKVIVCKLCWPYKADVLSPVGLFIDEARRRSQFFQKLLYFHVRQECSKVAHCMAQYASNIFDFVLWMKAIPFIVYDVKLKSVRESVKKSSRVCT